MNAEASLAQFIVTVKGKRARGQGGKDERNCNRGHKVHHYVSRQKEK